MLKMRPSARPRVATSSISVNVSATTFSRTTSITGAPLSSTITWAPDTPARSSMTSWRKPRRRVTVRTRPTCASGLSTASSVTRTVSATGRPLTSWVTSACSSCVTLPRRHSRSQEAGAACAALPVSRNALTAFLGSTPHAQQTSSSPTLALFFIVLPHPTRPTAPPVPPAPPALPAPVLPGCGRLRGRGRRRRGGERGHGRHVLHRHAGDDRLHEFGPRAAPRTGLHVEELAHGVARRAAGQRRHRSDAFEVRTVAGRALVLRGELLAAVQRARRHVG